MILYTNHQRLPTQQVLSLKKLGRFKYPVPQIHEQQKIATVLSSQDKLVELKEKLLAEKQRQKKYLMQQLLTGKRRVKMDKVEEVIC